MRPRMSRQKTEGRSARLTNRSRQKRLFLLLLSLSFHPLLFTLYPFPLLPATAQTTQDRKAEADRLFQLGLQQHQSNNLVAASQSLRAALQIYRQINDRPAEIATLGNLGIISSALGNYDEAISYYEQGLVITREFQNQQVRQVEAHMLRNLGLTYVSLGEYEKAINLYQQALTLYQAVQNREGEAGVLNNLAGAHCFLSQYEQAIVYSRQALPILQQIQDRNGEALAFQNLGRSYIFFSEYDKAINYYQQALTIYQQLGDSESEANMLNSLGLAHNYLSQYDKALAYYQRAMPLFEQIKDLQGQARVWHNLGLAYRNLSQYDKAIAYYQQALIAYRQGENRHSEASILNNLGTVYNSLSQYARAISYYQQAITIYQQVEDRRGEAQGLNNLGEIYRNLAQYDRAITYYRQSLAISQQVKDRRGEANTLMNLGNTYDSLFQYDQAIKYFQQALTIFVQIKYQDGEANVRLNLGVTYHSLSQNDKALAYIQQALAIYQQVKNRNGEAMALNSLGNVFNSRLQYAKAITYFQQSLAIFTEVKDRSGEAKTLNNLGVSFHRLGNFAVAETKLFASLTVLESIRVDSGTDQNKVSIFEEQMNAYCTLQEVLVAQNKFLPALEVAERGRSRALVELLNSRLAQSQTEQPTISASRSIVATQIKSPDIQQIRQIARSHNATLVQYSLGCNYLYTWVIAPSGDIAFHKTNLQSFQTKHNLSLADLVEQSRDTIGARGRSDVWVAQTPEQVQRLQAQQTRNLKQLHGLLIAPIADLLPKDPNQRVIFMPQGELFLVPFPALLDAKGTALIEQHTILTAPSIQVLELTRQQRQAMQPAKHKMQNALIVGNPTMPKVVTRVGDPPVQLSDLPGAKQEAVAIAKLFNTQAITGAQATKAAIAQQMPNARIIHLATHGLLDDTKGLGVPGAIALAPAGTGELNDGLLTAAEILDMRLNAELVVLSACDTGRGRITGDGVIGLSRSLITAGVPSIVVSLWKVPDDSTAFLMTEFYKNLRTTNDKAQALRQAMLTTKQKYSDPLHWAAFTLIGEAE